MNMTHARSSGMNISQWKVLGGVAALLLLGTVGCTDPTVAPKSTVTGANYFNDPNSYVQFLAKVYGGLALSGQAGPAADARISGCDAGLPQLRVPRLVNPAPTHPRRALGTHHNPPPPDALTARP